MKTDDRIAIAAPNSPAAEAYVALRTNMSFAGVGQEVRTLLIAGPTEGCGKSTVALNLAYFSATGGMRVVLVDADLRKQAVTRHFGLFGRVGLSNFLVPAPALPTLNGWYKANGRDFYVLPSGPLPPASADLLNSPQLRQLITSLKESCDLVIIDSPPLLAVADSSILAGIADGTLLVVNLKHNKRREIRRAVDALDKVKANLLGVVVNGASGVGHEYYQYAAYGLKD